MAAPVRIDELTAGGSLSAGASVAVVQSNDTFRTTPQAFITEAESFSQSGSGATARTVQSKLRDYWVSVKDYGAVGDGVADDTTAIQQALTALAVTGGVVFAPRGDYLISSKLSIPAGVSFHGEGKRLWATTASIATRQRGTRITTNSAITMVGIEGVSGAVDTQTEQSHIRHMTIDGNDVATVGVRFWDFINCGAEDVFVWRCVTGIQPGLTDNPDVGGLLYLRDVMITNGTTGIDSSASYEKVFCTWDNVEIRTMTGDAVKGPYTGAVTGGFVGGIAGISYNLLGAQQFSVTGQQMENCFQAAYVDTNPAGSLAIAENVSFISCSVTGNSFPMDKAFDVEQCRGFTAINNKIGFSGQSATMTGFDFGATAFDLTVLGNEFQSIGGSQTRYVHTSGARGLVNDRTTGWYFGAATGNQWTFAPPSGVTRAYAVQQSTDSGPRYSPFTDGSLNWGDGAGALDIKLSRSAADTLRLATGDSFIPQSTGQLLGGSGNQWLVYNQVVATASLASAGASMNGAIVIEDAGTGDRNLIIYAGGQRFRIDGGAAF